MKSQILKAIETKDSGLFKDSVEGLVSELTTGLDPFTVTAIINELKFQREGKRGRVASPFTVEKNHSTGGQRGRPALTVDQKILRMKERLDRETAELLAQKNSQAIASN